MGILKDRYADLYGEHFYVSPEYTAYDCMAEGTLRCTIRARTMEEAESLFAEELDRAEEDHPGLQLRLQWVTEDE